jgi:cytochrome c oxidase subunit 2
MNPRAFAASCAVALCACSATSGSVADAGAALDVAEGAEVIEVSAGQWSYEPDTIALYKDVAVVLRLTSKDVHHGFNVPDLGIRVDVLPGRTTDVRVTPKAQGTFLFHCDYYCGSGHEEMQGRIVVR